MNDSDAPVLFLIFNRIETTKKVFFAIKEAKPSRLYIAADGARKDKFGEEEKVALVRKFVVDNVDWDCKMVTFFREENLGCRKAVSTAIKWFFSHEEEGIILEDDCLPSKSFFTFCSILLEKYRYDERIRHIGGTNIKVNEQVGDGSYYFSNFTQIWGWASWRRVWNSYDENIRSLEFFEEQNLISEIYSDKWIGRRLISILKSIANNKIDTWDYQYVFLNFTNNGLSVIPNKNLIKNIGFGADATHTYNEYSEFANLKIFEVEEIIHPRFFIPRKTIDINYFKREFKFSFMHKIKYHILSTLFLHRR